jgi:hypothetical protein
MQIELLISRSSGKKEGHPDSETSSSIDECSTLDEIS